MKTTELDLDYIREIGEDLRSRLFPRPKQIRNVFTGQDEDGPTPYPLPVAIQYQPGGEVNVRVKFVVVRTIQLIGVKDLPDINPNLVDVTVGEEPSVTVEFSFGDEPRIVAAVDDPLLALFRAITGVL